LCLLFESTIQIILSDDGSSSFGLITGRGPKEAVASSLSSFKLESAIDAVDCFSKASGFF